MGTWLTARHGLGIVHARHQRLPREPTVYLCAQDRGDGLADEPTRLAERLLCLVNAPAIGDRHRFDTPDIASCATATFKRLERCGLSLQALPEQTVITTPTDFHRLFPGTGGALYGPASQGWMSAFSRPGSRR